VTLCIGNLKFGEMELGEMKRNTSNWSNFCMLPRRAGASAGLSFRLSRRTAVRFNSCPQTVKLPRFNCNFSRFSFNPFVRQRSRNTRKLRLSSTVASATVSS